MALPNITDDECKAVEKLQTRLANGVPPLRELSAAETKLVHSFAAKALPTILDLSSQLIQQTAIATAQREELDAYRVVQQQSMGLGPERKRDAE